MEEFLPWMLLLIGGDPAQADALTLERRPGVSVTREECETAGREAVKADGVLAYRCLQVPGGEEVETAWARVVAGQSHGAAR